MGTGVIDKLVVQLGIENKEFLSGQKKTEESLKNIGKTGEQESKRLESSARRQADAYSKVKTELSGLFALMIGARGLREFFDTFTKSYNALGRISTNLNIEKQSLAAWGDVAKSVGGTAEGFYASMQSLATGIQNFSLGEMSSVIQALRGLNVSVTDGKGGLRSYTDIFLDVADRIKGITPQEQLKVAQMLGWDEGTLQLARRSTDEIRTSLAQMEAHRQKTNEATEGARKLTDAIGKLTNRFADIRDRLYAEVSPGLEKFLETLSKIIDRVLEFDKSSGGWVIKIAAIGTAFLGIATAAGTALAAIRLVSGALGVASIARVIGGAAGAVLGGPVGAVVGTAAVGGLGVLISKMMQNSDKSAKSENALPAMKNANAGTSTESSAALFSRLEKKYGLSEGTLDKIWTIESGRGKNMVSPAGATGHFQFMPRTAAEYGLSRENTFELHSSANAAARKISNLIKYYKGDEVKAIAAYNFGEGNLNRTGLGGIPRETRDYLRKFYGADVNKRISQSNMQTMNNKNETHIGSINIQTQATDAQGIARSIKPAMENSWMATQTGMN